MELRVLLRANVHRAIASTAFVATPRVRDCAALVRRQKKVREPMERAVRSSRKPIRTMNVGLVEGAGETRRVNFTMARLVRQERNVFLIIASTAFVVETSARARVMPVVRRKRDKARMALADRLPIRAIRTMSAIPANAMARALATRRKCSLRTEPLAPWRRNVCRDFAAMACVATRHARACVKPVVRRKRVVEQMGRVGTSNTMRIPITNVPTVLVQARAPVNSTMA